MGQPASSARVTLRDVARRLKISHSTVSRILRDDPRFSDSLREKVQRVAREMGYRPDPMLTALAHYRQGKTDKPVQAALAWINRWPDPRQLRSFKEFDLYWKGASAEAERAGYRLEEFVIGPQLSAARLEKILLTRNIQGLLLPPGGGVTDWSDIHWESFCTVRFGHAIQHPRAHLVTSDQMTDGLIAFENIARHGYRRIGFVTHASTTTRFMGGFVLGQLRVDSPQRLAPLVIAGTTEAADRHDLVAWMKNTRPDAIFTDLPFLRALLAELKYRVPKDLGLATTTVLDGNADAGIYQNSEEIGRVAVQLLISLIHHNERGIPEICREVLVEGRWQDGSTLPRR